MEKSRLKNAFYILIGLAIAYSVLMVSALDNTILVKEGFTANLVQTRITDPSTDISNKAANSVVSYHNTIRDYRNKLDFRLKDLKTNKPDVNTGYNTTIYTSIVWATLATVLLFLIFTELE